MTTPKSRSILTNHSASTFSLSDACRAAQSVTPQADARERRLFLVWTTPAFILAVAAWHAAGPFAAAAALAGGLAVWWAFRARIGRRRRELWETPLPDAYEKFLSRRIPHYQSLDADGRELFRQRIKLFLDTVPFNGAGVKITDNLRLYAASAAVAMSLGFEEWEWPWLREIIFRPNGYRHGIYEDEGGVVTEYEESGMLGVPGNMAGAMMLSLRDLLHEFHHLEEGANVAIHEFAHLMVAEGLMLAEEDRGKWEGILESEAKRIRRGESLLDSYALLNEDEFFAMSSELFFTVPRRFRSWHRKVYAVLSRCYRSDPAAWLDTGEGMPDRPPKRRKRRDE